MNLPAFAQSVMPAQHDGRIYAMMKLVLGPLIQSRLWCESRNSCAVCLWLGWTFILRASYDYMCYNSVLRQPLDWKRRPRAQISIMVDLLLRRKRGTTKQILHCVLVTFGSADGHSGPTFSPLLRWIALTSINYGPLHYLGSFKKALWKTLLKLSIGLSSLISEVLEAMPTPRLSAWSLHLRV
jgi:hypothetical protein